MSSRTAGGALLSVLLVALAACDASGPGGASPDPTAETSAGTPAAEGTGAEDPAPNGGGKPAIETVGLPVGGGGQTGERNQCVFVNWTNADGGINVPQGIQATVTEVRLDRGVTTGACDDIDSCEGYTFTPASEGCSVGVTAEPGTATLFVGGHVTCSLSAAECATLLSGAGGSAGSIPITGPDPSPSPTESPTWSPTPTETEGPETSSPTTDEPSPTG